MKFGILIATIFAIQIAFVSCSKKDSEQNRTQQMKTEKSNTEPKKNSVTDYLNTGNEIIFENEKYNLVWSSNPSPNYYKQEYLSSKDSLEKFKKLILIEAIVGKTDPKSAADIKVAELKKLKQIDPMVNFDLFEKNGEIMLDFIVSNKIPDSEVIERNVYRYKTFTDKNSKEGVLLFGVCERAYGNDITNFLTELKAKRFDVPNAAGSFQIPQITISGKE